MPANTATDFSKLSGDDLQDKLKEATARIEHLHALESRDAEQEAEMVDCIGDAEAIQATLASRAKEETNRRIERLKKFDAPNPRKSGGNRNSADNFDSLGERLQAVAIAGRGGRIDPRLFNALGANETTPSDGGFFVGSDEENDLMSKVYGSPILSRIPRTPISAASNMLNLRLLQESSRADGSRQGGVQAYWLDEAESITASRQKYEKFSLPLEDLCALSYATEQLLTDAPALQAEMSAGFNEEMTFKIEDAVINGDGVSKPLGILKSPAKVAVSVEDGQTAADPLLYENVAKMWARLHPRSQMNAVWLVDQTMIPYLLTLHISVGTGGQPVYQPANGAADAPFGTILGRPVLFTEYTKAANTEGDIILWDPTSYRLIEKGGFKFAEIS